MSFYINEEFYLWNGFRKPTFAGILDRFWECYDDYGINVGISRDWDKIQQKKYGAYYNERILPVLPNGKAMESYTRAEFIDAINELNQKYSYNETDDINYEDLIKIVCEVAQEQLSIINCWDDKTREVKFDCCGREMLDDEEKLIMTSLSKSQMKIIRDALMKPFDEVSGEELGFIFVAFCGCNNGEAAALNFGDIKLLHDYPSSSVLIYKTTIKNTNQIGVLDSQYKYRKVPLLEFVSNYISKYRFYIETLVSKKELILPEGLTIDNLPIAHKSNNFFERCTAVDLSVVGVRLFEALGYNIKHLKEVHNTIINIERIDEIEKDPVTYMCRRTYGTYIYGRGLKEEEFEYCLGLPISNKRYKDVRDIFANDDIQYEMYCKLMKSPFDIKHEDN